jgi:hypothetical protein
MRRGDNIPTVADYAHWNEEAEAMWYAENRYDMEHADEEMDDGSDWDGDSYRDEPDPFEESFVSETDARAFMEKYGLVHDCDGVDLSEWGGKWYVEHYDEKAHRSRRPH